MLQPKFDSNCYDFGLALNAPVQLLAEQVLESVIREVKPQVVMLELDAGRLDDLPSGSSVKVGIFFSL